MCTTCFHFKVRHPILKRRALLLDFWFWWNESSICLDFLFSEEKIKKSYVPICDQPRYLHYIRHMKYQAFKSVKWYPAVFLNQYPNNYLSPFWEAMMITPQAYNVNEEYVDNVLICWSYDTPSRSTTSLLQALMCLIIYGVLVNMLLVDKF